jgi:hypothetical protein
MQRIVRRLPVLVLVPVPVPRRCRVRPPVAEYLPAQQGPCPAVQGWMRRPGSPGLSFRCLVPHGRALRWSAQPWAVLRCLVLTLAVPGWVVPGWVVPGWVVPGWVVPGWVVPGWVVPGWVESASLESCPELPRPVAARRLTLRCRSGRGHNAA